MAPPGKPDIKVTASDALEFEPVIHEPPKRRWGLKTFVVLVLAAGGAGAWHFYGDRIQQLLTGGEGGIPLIKSAATSVKVRPDNPGGLEVPDRDKLVYDRIQGTAEGRGPERLLPPPEKPLPRPAPAKATPPPADKAATVAQPQALPIKPVAKVPTAEDVASAERPAPPPPPPAPPTASKSSPLVFASPRRTAKPAPAQAKTPEPAPVEPAPKPKPEKLAVPEAKPSPPEPPATAAATPAPPPPTPAAAPRPAPASPAFLVQLAAARTQQGAETEWEKLRSRNQDLLGNLRLTVTKADLGPRGIYYRLRAGPIADESAARALCSQLTKRQVGCLVIKPGQ